jgi:ubiquinone/menaquinone biosynthesis C-methylase UbiE
MTPTPGCRLPDLADADSPGAAGRICQLCGEPALREFVVPGKTKFLVCPRCRLYQYGPLVDNSAYDAGTYHNSYREHRSRKLRTARVRLNRIAPLTRAARPVILDVGCGTGSILHAARERGWTAMGVDVSTRAVAECREQGWDCHVVQGVQLPFEDCSFDVLTSWSVIEHVPDVRATLREWHRVLRPGGIVAVDTSTSDYLKARLLGSRYRRFWPVGHTYTFNAQNLARFFVQAGFTLEPQPFVGRLAQLDWPMRCYAVAYQLQYELRRALRLQRAFQLFARRKPEDGSLEQVRAQTEALRPAEKALVVASGGESDAAKFSPGLKAP